MAWHSCKCLTIVLRYNYDLNLMDIGNFHFVGMHYNGLCKLCRRLPTNSQGPRNSGARHSLPNFLYFKGAQKGSRTARCARPSWATIAHPYLLGWGNP